MPDYANGALDPHKISGKRVKIPTSDQVDEWHRSLLEQSGRLDDFMKRRGLTLPTIKEAQLGWSHEHSRYTIPIFDADRKLIAVKGYRLNRRTASDGPKMIFIPGGHISLYGSHKLADTDWACIVEGELDSLTLTQRGIPAVGHTGGAENWRNEWAEAFEAKDVWVIPDEDDPGRAFGQKVVASMKGHAKQAYIVDLATGKPKTDVTDYLVKYGYTIDDLRERFVEASGAPRLGSPRRRRRVNIPGVTRASDITIKSVRWLWYPYLPTGKIIMLDGNPGRAKSMLSILLAAHVVLGVPFPSSAPQTVKLGQNRPPRRLPGVVIVCTEDDWEDTVGPRLIAAIKSLQPRISDDGLQAALQRVAAVRATTDDKGRMQPFQIPGDVDRLQAAIRQVRAALVVVDPIMAYLGEDVNPYVDQNVRQGLSPLQSMAEKMKVAVVLIRHFTKDTKAAAENRGGGSLGGFLGLARGGWLVERHPEEPGVLVLANYKNNLAARGESIRYSVEPYLLEHDDVTVDTAFVRWGDFCDLDADSLLRAHDARLQAPVRDECMAALETLMADRDPYPADEIRKLLEKAGFKLDTIKAAKKKLGVRSEPERDAEAGHVIGWVWTRKPEEP